MTLHSQASSTGFLDLSIVFAVAKYDPKVFTDQFLKAKGIIPNDWQLAQPVRPHRQQIELLFKNGVRIIGEPGAIRFVESMVNKISDDLAIPEIARKFAASVPNIDYRSVGINPRRYASFSDTQDGAIKFINEFLLTPSPWQKVGKAPVRSNIDLGFSLEQCLLRVNIQEARIKLQDQKPASAILFMGNYHYSIQADTIETILTNVNRAMDNLSAHLADYEDLIDTKFLGKNQANKLSKTVAKIEEKPLLAIC